MRQTLAEAAGRLQAAGVAGAQQEAAWLLAFALTTDRGGLYREPDRVLTPAEAAIFGGLLARRERREPLQYILGTQPFFDLDFLVNPHVLIPRPETERLVEAVLERLQPAQAGDGLQLADIGTGSGCIAVTLARRLPAAVVWAVDVSAEALAVAHENARRHGVAGRVRFVQGDLVQPLHGLGIENGLAAIVSNPPYVSAAQLAQLMPEVRDYEPGIALTPGCDELAAHRRLAAGAPGLLRPGGMLAVEVGVGQAAHVAALMSAAGLAMPAVVADDAGIERVVIGLRAAQAAPATETRARC